MFHVEPALFLVGHAVEAHQGGVESHQGGMNMATARQKSNRLPAEKFAFPKKRKEPITDASHVRNAIARFDQVEGVSDTERDAAWRRIRAAARKFGIEIHARGWRSLMKSGNTRRRRRQRSG